MNCRCSYKDLGTFRVGDKPAREVLDCFELGHPLEPSEFADYMEYACPICEIRYRVKIEDEQACPPETRHEIRERD